MTIAAFWGTSVGYTEYGNDSVVLETIDGRVAVIKKATFDYLYYRLDEFNAALKEDCVHYAVYSPEKDLIDDYPTWFIEACEDGLIYDDSRFNCFLYEQNGEVAVAPNSIIMRNYKGELKHIEGYKFHQFYDTLRE